MEGGGPRAWAERKEPGGVGELWLRGRGHGVGGAMRQAESPRPTPPECHQVLGMWGPGDTGMWDVGIGGTGGGTQPQAHCTQAFLRLCPPIPPLGVPGEPHV